MLWNLQIILCSVNEYRWYSLNVHVLPFFRLYRGANGSLQLQYNGKFSIHLLLFMNLFLISIVVDLILKISHVSKCLYGCSKITGLSYFEMRIELKLLLDLSIHKLFEISPLQMKSKINNWRDLSETIYENMGPNRNFDVLHLHGGGSHTIYLFIFSSSIIDGILFRFLTFPHFLSSFLIFHHRFRIWLNTYSVLDNGSLTNNSWSETTVNTCSDQGRSSFVTWWAVEYWIRDDCAISAHPEAENCCHFFPFITFIVIILPCNLFSKCLRYDVSDAMN